MFSNATKNEASFPPKCCGQEISLKEAACCLHRPQIKAFEQSAREFNTPVASRRYCADSKCSSFLGRGNRDILRCNRCTNLTCNGCLRYAHPGQCSVDHEPKHLELLGKLAKEEGWQQCSACERFLDKSAGCNHITSVTILLVGTSLLLLTYWIVAPAVTSSATCAVLAGGLAAARNSMRVMVDSAMCILLLLTWRGSSQRYAGGNLGCTNLLTVDADEH